MEKVIELKRKDGQKIKAKLILLDDNYMDKIMELQEVIYLGLDDKQLYSPSTKEEFSEFISEKGRIVGCVTEDNELVAMGVYCKLGYEESNYGYDIELHGEELLKVGQIESTLVKAEYRGNRLQKKICEVLEAIGKANNTPIMCATASPYNDYSVNTFKNLGYKIAKDKIKYGGLRRYVLVKEL
ncbi:GNAT family N-acetyltransferase [Clostridium paraputrificum]|uniref:GNAT family N-acetyltransferase n=1 Tax=Clostridium TaxID=1485 RepID=UPI003D34D58E